MKIKMWLFVFVIFFITSCSSQVTSEEVTLSNPKQDIPIEFIDAWITKGILDNPEARITFKNVSDKTIDGVKIIILCYDNFGDMDSGKNAEIYNAITQEVIEPDEIYDGDKKAWNLFPYDNTTKFKAYLMEVHFTDGTTWETKDLGTAIISK